MKVITFHCEQTEASLRGNRPMVWPIAVGPDDLSQAERGCLTDSQAKEVMVEFMGESVGLDRPSGNMAGIAVHWVEERGK